jgi:hypothetical protein
MADVQHSAIADPDIHEPKGVAAAAAGKVYVANGTGSGVWGLPLPTGVDSATSGQVLVADGVGSATWQAVPASDGDYGEMYVQGNATATTITTSSTFVQVSAGATAGQLSGPTHSGGALTLITSAKYLMEASLTLFGIAATTIVWEVDFLVNGAAFGRKQAVTTTGTELVPIDIKAISGLLSVGDTIAIGISNTSDTNDPTVVHADLVIRQL